MTYEEIKVGETYLYNSNKEYKVLYKHDETQSVFTFNYLRGVACSWAESEFKDFKPKVKPLPKTGLMVYSDTDVIYYRTGEQSGYGFNGSGNFRVEVSLSFKARPEDWIEATKEDYLKFRDLVIEHLKGLGFKEGDSFVSLVRGYVMTFSFRGDIEFGDDECIYLGGKIVFDGNTWIKPISAQNKLKKEIETRLEKVIKELEQTIQQLKKDIKE